MIGAASVLLAHHAGEQLVLAALAGGSAVAGGVAVVARAKIDRVRRWLGL